jgi:hypothetical protein
LQFGARTADGQKRYRSTAIEIDTTSAAQCYFFGIGIVGVWARIKDDVIASDRLDAIPVSDILLNHCLLALP